MSRSYSAVFVDLDGTLVEYGAHTVSDASVAAIRRARHEGVHVVVCTGRTRYMARPVVERIGAEGYGICLNGAAIVEWATDLVVHSCRLSERIAREAFEVLRSVGLAPLCFGVVDDDRWVYTDVRVPMHPLWEARASDRMVVVQDLLTDLPVAPISMEAYGSFGQTAEALAGWSQRFGGAATVYQWAAGTQDVWGVHIHSADANKGLGASIVSDLLGVPRERCLAIGDEVNDLDLLAWAGLGVAMGSGNPRLRQAADHVTGACADEGVAQAFERFLFAEAAVCDEMAGHESRVERSG